MNTLIKPLPALTADDVMSVPVQTIPRETTLRVAAELLTQAHISGAPVVDEAGRCIGVLSSSDFVTWVAGEEAGRPQRAIGFIAPWGETVVVDDAPDTAIGHYMTAQPVTVTARATLGDMAQQMVDAHIHRVVVVADDGQPCGIVTSTDILAAVAQEARHSSKKPRPSRTRKSSRHH